MRSLWLGCHILETLSRGLQQGTYFKIRSASRNNFWSGHLCRINIHECIQNDNLFKVLQESLMIRPLFFPISETILFSWYLYIPINIVWGSFCFSKSGTPFFFLCFPGYLAGTQWVSWKIEKNKWWWVLCPWALPETRIGSTFVPV